MTGPGAPEPTVARSVATAAAALVQHVGRLLVATVGWLTVGAVVLLAGGAFPPAYVLALALVPVTCGLTRMAVHAVRDLPVRLGQFREGAGHRRWAQLGLGGSQALVLVLAGVNVGIGVETPTLPLVVAAVASANIGVAIWVLAVTTWPLLLDPELDETPTSQVLRLGLAAALVHPLRSFLVALIGAALVAASVQVVPLALVVPASVTLLAAAYALPTADRLLEG